LNIVKKKGFNRLYFCDVWAMKGDYLRLG